MITGIDGVPIFAFEQLRQRVEGSNGETLGLEVWRDGQVLDLALTPKRTDEPLPEGGFRTVYRIGIVGGFARAGLRRGDVALTGSAATEETISASSSCGRLPAKPAARGGPQLNWRKTPL